MEKYHCNEVLLLLSILTMLISMGCSFEQIVDAVSGIDNAQMEPANLAKEYQIELSVQKNPEGGIVITTQTTSLDGTRITESMTTKATFIPLSEGNAQTYELGTPTITASEKWIFGLHNDQEGLLKIVVRNDGVSSEWEEKNATIYLVVMDASGNLTHEKISKSKALNWLMSSVLAKMPRISENIQPKTDAQNLKSTNLKIS